MGCMGNDNYTDEDRERHEEQEKARQEYQSKLVSLEVALEALCNHKIVTHSEKPFIIRVFRNDEGIAKIQLAGPKHGYLILEDGSNSQ